MAFLALSSICEGLSHHCSCPLAFPALKKINFLSEAWLYRRGRRCDLGCASTFAYGIKPHPDLPLFFGF